MTDYERALHEEKLYLERTLEMIRKELGVEREELQERTEKMLDARREMWDNAGPSTGDFTKMAEANQYLMEVKAQTLGYGNTQKRVERYYKMLEAPYFGRFDFIEDDFSEREKIYVGLANVMDSQTRDIYVYDWRTPVASLYYRYEPGPAQYIIPGGMISGEVLLKRQYRIRQGRLDYFFDCSIRINDKMLQDVLYRNASTKMRQIVETIQKEQDLIIRDRENDLLIVQGVAGSGKTSVALHRVAYLLYDGLGSKLNANNILIVSPNAVFSSYISSVLPELGEDNVEQVTFDEIGMKCLEKTLQENRLETESRMDQLEYLTRYQHERQADIRRQGIQFKGSTGFLLLLERFLHYVEHRWIDFQDIYLNGKVLTTRQQLKAFFLSDDIDMPIARRLERIERRIMEQVRPLRKKRLEWIEEIVQQSEGHDLEIKSFSRLLSIKETRQFSANLHRFTKINGLSLYKMLFENQQLFHRLAAGIDLPDQMEQITALTLERFNQGIVCYEDVAPLIYLELKIEGIHHYSHLKQVVVDEAQDYYPLQYEIFKALFKEAQFTILGDICQAMERKADLSLYEHVLKIMDKPKAVMLTLNKSYRASHEINTFARRFLDQSQDFVSFERHEAEPQIIQAPTLSLLRKQVVKDIHDYRGAGYDTIVLLCKTGEESRELYLSLKGEIPVKLLDRQDEEIEKGITIMPVYMAKGLEFDVVLVWRVTAENYVSAFDRRLLYIAATRALHRLAFYWSGEKSNLL